MNLHSNSSDLLRSILLSLSALLLGFGGAASAQPADRNLPPGAGVSAAAATARTENTNDNSALAKAKLLARTGNILAAEREMTANSRFREGTSEWYVDAGEKLSRLAGEVARTGERASVSALANNALQHLEKADTPNLSKARRAAIKQAAGRIHEELRGDYASALSSYGAAVKENPADKTAVAAFERLREADARLRARVQANRKQ